MKVLKFGGTSVGSPERMKKLLDIIKPEESQIVVLSAVSGTTNSLVEISQAYLNNDKKKAGELTDSLLEKYKTFIAELFSTEEGLKNGRDLIEYHFNLIPSLAAIDLILPLSLSFAIKVPGAAGSIVLSSRTGILYFCAGKTL